jgi:hypothetical protein
VGWLTTNPTGGRYLELRATVNGQLGAVPAAANQLPSSTGLVQSVSTDFKLAAGDYVEAFGIQDSGSDLTLGKRSFTMSWVAPG